MDISYCPYCGSKLNDTDESCPGCGAGFPCKNIQLKVPVVSAILSAFFPGLGQMYNGDKLSKGLLFFFGFAIGSLLWFVPGILIWIFGMYDAYRKADMMQKGEVNYIPADNRNILLVVLIPLIVMLFVLAITIHAIYSIYGGPERMLYEMMYSLRVLQT